MYSASDPRVVSEIPSVITIWCPQTESKANIFESTLHSKSVSLPRAEQMEETDSKAKSTGGINIQSRH